MVKYQTSAAFVAAVLLPLCSADGLYAKGSPVLQVDGKRYYTDIAESNHTSIVEFYAPWCGHCKNLKPAYEKAAKSLAGLAKVAAVNCDDESNKPFCGTMGVQGFPTLKIVRPGKKAGRPNVEDYQGPRTAKGIVEAVKDKIPNHVKRLTDSTLEEWLEADADKPKAILFTEKGTTSALIKAIAIDFLGVLNVAQVRSKETAVAEKYKVTDFPALVLLPGSGKDAVKYSGAFEKAPIVTFLSDVATPNPDPAPKAKKAASTPSGKKASSASSKLSKASASHKSAESKATPASETLEDDASESPKPWVKGDQQPIQLPIPTLPMLQSDAQIRASCLTPKSKACALFFQPVGNSVPTETELDAMTALNALAEVHDKFATSGAMFPIYAVPSTGSVRRELGLEEAKLGLVVVNAKKGWVKRYEKKAWSRLDLEDWIDGLRMGEGKKENLKDGLVRDLSSDEEKTILAAEQKAGAESGETINIGVDGEGNVMAEKEGVKAKASHIKTKATEEASATASSVKNAAGDATNSAKSAASDAKSSVSSAASAAKTAVSEGTEKVKDTVAGATDKIKGSSAASDSVKAATDSAKASAASATDKVKGSSAASDTVKAATDSIKSKVAEATDAIKGSSSGSDTAKAATDAIKSKVTGATDAVKGSSAASDSVKAATDKVKSAVSEGIQAAKDKADAAAGKTGASASASSVASKASSKVKVVADSVKEKVVEGTEKVKGVVHEEL